VRYIPIALLSPLVAILVGAILVAVWPIVLIGTLIVVFSKGSDVWRDPVRRMHRDDRHSRHANDSGSHSEPEDALLYAHTLD